MNCPPPTLGGSALAIMPANIYPHYSDFLSFAQCYWREKDFAERVDQFFNWYFSRYNPYDLTPEEKKKVHNSAVHMAELIVENRKYPFLVNSLLNWGHLYKNP